MYGTKGGVTKEKDYGVKGKKTWRGFVSEEVILGIRDCSLSRVPRTSHRLYMHDLEDGKAWTKLIPAVLVSKADLPSDSIGSF